MLYRKSIMLYRKSIMLYHKVRSCCIAKRILCHNGNWFLINLFESLCVIGGHRAVWRRDHIHHSSGLGTVAVECGLRTGHLGVGPGAQLCARILPPILVLMGRHHRRLLQPRGQDWRRRRCQCEPAQPQGILYSR